MPTTNSDQITKNPYLLREHIKYHNLSMAPTATMAVYRVAMETWGNVIAFMLRIAFFYFFEINDNEFNMKLREYL